MQANHFPQMTRAALPLLVLSCISNMAILISPLFMMQVLDRVLPSGNMATLVLLGGLALLALTLQALVEAARDLALGRLARWGEREGTAQALAPNANDPNNTVQKVAALSAFLTGPAGTAALSLPWVPVFLSVLLLLHPAFLMFLVTLFGLAALTSKITQMLARASHATVAEYAAQEELTLQQASIAQVRLGVAQIAHNLRQRFSKIQRGRHTHVRQAEVLNTFRASIAGLLRNSGQIGALAIGAWLVTIDQLSPGGMIAGSIIATKAYGALENALIHWPTILSARANFKALCGPLKEPHAHMQTVAKANGALRAEGLIFPRGGGAPPRLDRVSFALAPGECLAIVGSSGSGKSTLLQALAGVSPVPIGSVYLDEHDLRSLSRRALFEQVGYLPQRADLDMGTISENISCFEPDPDHECIIEAAKTAGVYGLVGALPDGFDTDLRANPHLLSAGQAQRLSLARAIYMKPQYLFLDEPNALLDADGERALGQTLLRLKTRGTTIVIILHRSGIMGLADKVMQLENGRVADFGKRSDVLHRLGIGGRQIELPVLSSSNQDLEDWISSYFTRATDQEFCQKAKRVSAGLFRIAKLHCPPDSLRFARFYFKFISDAQCEITMIEPIVSDVARSLMEVKQNLKAGLKDLSPQSKEHDLLTQLSGFCQGLEITSEAETTRYKARLVLEHAEQPTGSHRDLPRSKAV